MSNSSSDPLWSDPFALRRLTRAGDVKSIEELATDRGAATGTRAAAVEALGRMNSRGSLPLFEAMLREEPWELRAHTVRALGKLKDHSGEELLTAGLDDPHVAVRAHAANSLGKLRSRHAVPRLVDSLANDDWLVSASAAQALARIGDRRALEPLRDQRSKQKNLRGKRIFTLALLRLRLSR